MTAVAPNLPPRPKPGPNEPGMFAFADPQHVTEVLIAAGWAPTRFEKLDMDLDIAAGRGLEEGCRSINRNRRCEPFVRNQPAQVISAAPSPLRAALAPYADGLGVRLPDEVDRQRAGLNEHCSKQLSESRPTARCLGRHAAVFPSMSTERSI